MLIWKCECGWQSSKSGAEGSAEALTHARVGKQEDSKKHPCFLFDTDAQKPVLDNDGKVLKSLAKAQSLGIIPRGKEKKPKPQSSSETQVTGVSQDSFTPAGTPSDLKTPQWLTIGTFRMPYEDWGYSSAVNLLVVAETYAQAKKEYSFNGKVGDFLAELCQAFRIMKGWDVIAAGYQEPVEITKGSEK